MNTPPAVPSCKEETAGCQQALLYRNSLCQMSNAYELANRVTWAEGNSWRLAQELDRANLRIAQLQQNEDAFSAIIRRGGATYAADKTGRLVEIIDHEIEWAYHVLPQYPSNEDPFYMIKLRHVDQRAVLTEKEFASDAGLIQALQKLPGVHVRRNRSRTVTAFLLREALDVTTIVLEFYGGWLETEGSGYRFFSYEPLTTHRKDGEVEALQVLQPVADSSDALRRFVIHLHQVINGPLRDYFTLWFHVAAVMTLLDALGYPFQLALCVDSADVRAKAWLKALFTWFGDDALSLDMFSHEFQRKLCCRKDQPVLVLAQRCTRQATANAELMTQVVAAGRIPEWRKSRNTQSLPLQALPVILSDAASSLSCSPCCMVVETNRLDLKDNCRPIDQETLHRYLCAFLCYTQDHIPRLRELLFKRRQEVLDRSVAELNCLCSDALGVLLALKDFLNEFAQACGFSGYEWCNEMEPWLIAMLEQTSWKETDCGTLADQFVSVARSHINGGTLRVAPLQYREDPGDCVVYYDADGLSFTRAAFASLCKHLGQSGPVVLRALADAGMLIGKTINATTQMTRIGVWNVHGVRRSVAVYRLDRSAFDLLGDPMIFDEETGL